MNCNIYRKEQRELLKRYKEEHAELLKVPSTDEEYIRKVSILSYKIEVTEARIKPLTDYRKKRIEGKYRYGIANTF